MFLVKAAVHVKAVLTSLNTAFLLISRSRATLNLCAYLINHCLAVLCKFLGDFLGILGILGKRYFFSKDRLN